MIIRMCSLLLLLTFSNSVYSNSLPATNDQDLPQRTSPEPFLNRKEFKIFTLGSGGADPWAVGQNFSVKSIDQSFQTISVRLWPILSVPSKTDPYAVSVNLDSFTLQNASGLQVYRAGSSKLLAAATTVKLTISKNRLEVGSAIFPLEDYVIQPIANVQTGVTSPTAVMTEAGKVSAAYRGRFRIEMTLHEIVDRWTQAVTYSGKHWSLINDVLLEDYLYAVVPSEMPSSFGAEALKAQSVAARTYAVFHSWLARKVLSRTWDVDPTTWYQSYRGARVEHALVTPNVQATAGIILTSRDKVIEAFFSSNSGGSLCKISECFWLPDRPYAITKPDVDGVRQKPAGQWTSQTTPQGIWDRLQKLESQGRLVLAQFAPHIKGPQDILGLRAERLGESGRTWQLSVIPKSGNAVLLNEEFTREMRWQFGFKTSFYDLGAVGKSGQLVEGYGLGHGVGMSQWGAQLMSSNGKTYSDILNYYYEGITLAPLP